MQHHVRNDQSPEFIDERTVRAQQRRANRNCERAMALEQAMFDHRSRCLILVLTLSYKPEWRQTITLDDLRRHRDVLLNNARCNELLRGIDGYIWKIEEGEHLGGLHMHVVVFYDGTHRADVFIAQQIGEYWANVITRGRGVYWNSNAHKAEFELGPWGDATGQIDRGDNVKREALRNYLGQYIAKEDQQVSSRTNSHCRMFGTSQLPI